jgi:hypothetical protein
MKSKLSNSIVLFVFFLCSCDSGNNSLKKGASPYIGIYKIDLRKSIVGVYEKDTLSFKNLTLTIKPDKTFSFSIDMPFIRSQRGIWELRSIDGVDFLYLIYGKGSYGNIEDEVNLTLAKDIFIKNTRPKIDAGNIEKLFMQRVE